MIPVKRISDKENIDNGLLETVARLSNDKDFKRFTDYIIKAHVDLSVESTSVSGIEGTWAQGACQMLEILIDDMVSAQDLLTKIITDKKEKEAYIRSFGGKKPQSIV